MRIVVRQAFLVMLGVLLTVGTTSAEQKEAGPTGVPCKDPEPILRQSEFALDIGGPVRLKDGKDCPTEPAGRCQFQIELTRVEQWGTAPRFLLIIVNGAVVFASYPMRVIGAIIVAALIWAWIPSPQRSPQNAQRIPV